MAISTGIDVGIENLHKVKDRINKIKTAPERKGQQWCYRSAQGVAQIARRKAPSHTGTLKKSIKPKRLNLGGNKRGAAVVADTKKEGNPFFPGRSYAKAVEFGVPGKIDTKMSPPIKEAYARGLPFVFHKRSGTTGQPFMRPAFYESESKHKQFVGLGWSEEINKHLK